MSTDPDKIRLNKIDYIKTDLTDPTKQQCTDACTFVENCKCRQTEIDEKDSKITQLGWATGVGYCLSVCCSILVIIGILVAFLIGKNLS